MINKTKNVISQRFETERGPFTLFIHTWNRKKRIGGKERAGSEKGRGNSEVGWKGVDAQILIDREGRGGRGTHLW